MRYTFYLFGKPREDFLSLGYREYLKRLSRFGKVNIISLKAETIHNPKNQSEVKEALDKEASRVLSLVKEDDFLFLLDIHAPLFTSDDLAEQIQEAKVHHSSLSFLVGSSYGLSDLLRKRADVSFSLGKMTLTHYLAMLLTFEQVYRAEKILAGEAYDK